MRDYVLMFLISRSSSRDEVKITEKGSRIMTLGTSVVST